MENILLCSSDDNRLTYRLKSGLDYELRPEMIELQFYLTDTQPLTFMLRRLFIKDDNPVPAIFEKEMVVTLASGKWPLGDCIDCGQQTFVFQKADGSQFSMLLTGFTWMCSLPIKEQQIELDNSNTYYIRVIGELIP